MTKRLRRPSQVIDTKTSPEVTIGVQKSLKTGNKGWRWMSFLLATMIIAIMGIITIGCGGKEKTPSETVDKLFRLIQERDCQKVADLVTDTRPKLAESYVNDCPQIADRLVSYTITGETIYEGGISAVVDSEVTIKKNGKEETNSVPQFLVKRDDDWKLTTTENRE